LLDVGYSTAALGPTRVNGTATIWDQAPWIMDGEKLGIWVVRWRVGELDRGMWFGLRAVGLENRPTFAAHLDIGGGVNRFLDALGRYT